MTPLMRESIGAAVMLCVALAASAVDNARPERIAQAADTPAATAPQTIDQRSSIDR